MMDALKRASARRITAVIPYYGYARQDRKDRPRAPISSKLVADLLTTAGAHRALLSICMRRRFRDFFNIPVDHLFASPVLVDHFRKLSLPNLTVVSPDAGGVERARFFAKKVDAALAIVDKRRVEANVAEVMHVIGDVRGRTCLVIDDLIDTAGTLVKTASALMDNGASQFMHAARTRCFRGRRCRTFSNRVSTKWWSPTPFLYPRKRKPRRPRARLRPAGRELPRTAESARPVGGRQLIECAMPSRMSCSLDHQLAHAAPLDHRAQHERAGGDHVDAPGMDGAERGAAGVVERQQTVGDLGERRSRPMREPWTASGR